MRPILRNSLWAVLVLMTATGVGAQGVDLTGTWHLEAEAQLFVMPTIIGSGAGDGKGGVVPPQCEFEGTATIIQMGQDLQGEASLTPVAGTCPPGVSPVSMADLTGQVNGDQVTMGSMTSGAEGGTFDGGVKMVTLKGAAAPGSLSGSFTVTMGPFAGVSGIWSAEQVVAAPGIPAAGVLGLALLAMLLLAAGVKVLRG